MLQSLECFELHFKLGMFQISFSNVSFMKSEERASIFNGNLVSELRLALNLLKNVNYLIANF